MLSKDGVNVGYVYDTYLVEVNSKLAEAAPDLLKALKELLSQDRIKLAIEASGHLSEFNDKIYACKEAINKASKQ